MAYTPKQGCEGFGFIAKKRALPLRHCGFGFEKSSLWLIFKGRGFDIEGRDFGFGGSGFGFGI